MRVPAPVPVRKANTNKPAVAQACHVDPDFHGHMVPPG